MPKVLPWKQFELSVTEFLKALNDPLLKVNHNYKEQDRQTRRPRQRDIWIETRIGGLFPLQILVSCKRWTRKLDEEDIDHFHGELLGSHASLGVIYSYSGFNKPALEKAAAFNISCCTLLENSPPSIPEQLILHAFCCTPQLSLGYERPIDSFFAGLTWNTIFAAPWRDGQDQLSAVVAAYEQLEGLSRKSVPFPKEVSAVFLASSGTSVLRVIIGVNWRIYRARLSGYLLSGTYMFSEKSFHGTQLIPAIDRLGAHPGENWELLQSVPEYVPDGICVAVMSQPTNLRELVEKAFGAVCLENAS